MRCERIYEVARDGEDSDGPVMHFRMPGTSIRVLICACGQPLSWRNTQEVRTYEELGWRL